MLKLKLENRIILDCIMFLIFLTLHLKYVTAVKAHEYLGVAFVVHVVYHCLLNRGWIRGIFKIKISKRLIINIILFITFALTVVSGVMVSVVLFRHLNIEYNERWFRIHAWSGRLMLAAVVAHLFNHGKMIRNAFRKKRHNN